MSAQEKFQQGISCAKISNDLIVQGKDTDDHNKNLKAVLKRLSNVRLTLNKKIVFSISHQLSS